MKGGPNPKEARASSPQCVVAVAAAEGHARRALVTVGVGLGSWDCALLPSGASSSARQALTELDEAKAQFSALLTVLPGAPGAPGSAPFGVRFLRELLQEHAGFAVVALALAPLEQLHSRWHSQVLERQFLDDCRVVLLEPPHRLVDLLSLLGAGVSLASQTSKEV